MTWTQADLNKLQAAIMALATGTRTIAVEYQGPPARKVQYAAADLDALRSLAAEVSRKVNGTPRYSLAAFHRGFDRG